MTSADRGYSVGKALALGYVASAHAKEGQDVMVVGPDGARAGTIHLRADLRSGRLSRAVVASVIPTATRRSGGRGPGQDHAACPLVARRLPSVAWDPWIPLPPGICRCNCSGSLVSRRRREWIPACLAGGTLPSFRDAGDRGRTSIFRRRLPMKSSRACGCAGSCSPARSRCCTWRCWTVFYTQDKVDRETLLEALAIVVVIILVFSASSSWGSICGLPTRA